MKIGKIAAIYSIFVGIFMIGMWAAFLGTGQVPELNSKPIEITYHLIAEVLTAFALLIGGFGLLTNSKWDFQTYLVSMGMLLYTVIVSAGYFGQRENWVMVGMFTTFTILTATIIGLNIYKTDEFKPMQ